MASNTKEHGLEKEVIESCLLSHGWLTRQSSDFDREYAIDEGMLREFLTATQEEKVNRSQIFSNELKHKNFLTRLRNEISNRGVIHLLRHGLNMDSYTFMLYYPTPSKANPKAQEQYAQNRWVVMRQVHYSQTATKDSVDMVLMLNGLPIVTMELKNTLSGQNFGNAITQYQKDRSPKELLFAPKRCAVHFAVDDNEVYMCTELKGEGSWFLPFNKGNDHGAGNPVCDHGPKTSYLWEEILRIDRMSDIIEHYAQVVTEKDENTGKSKEKVIWPRYHQLEAVRALLADTKDSPEAGKRYLIQHSAGSGKSNSITWLAYQLADMKKADDVTARFESVLVITDRCNLDRQIRDNLRAFCPNKSLFQWADDSEALKTALNGGKKIIASTVCKFPFILQTIGHELKHKHFCVIIDEAHSSQSGGMAAALNSVIGGFGQRDIQLGGNQDFEDELNELLSYVIAGKVLAANTNFYAFTATPKHKTLEMFGTPHIGADGEKKFKAFHTYTMKQAIEEKFILDVLQHYTPYQSFYKIVKATEENPSFAKDQAQSKLRSWVERQPQTVEAKAKIMVEHFLGSVAHRLKGEARAMVVTPGIERAIDYFFAIKKLLHERQSPYQAMIAFSGTKEYNGVTEDEAHLNGFPSSQIEETFRTGNYRILVVADKFQTGYDEPLLHTMYVDKPLSDIKAVQTLSRLNRCAPYKKDTFVLDFANSAEQIEQAFQEYYTTTILSGETDINKLNDLLAVCDESYIYEQDEVTEFNSRFWKGEQRVTLDPILDRCVERFKTSLNDEEQIKVKSAMRLFCRTYDFLAAIMPESKVEWEMKYTFLRFLWMKLPKLNIDDPTAGLLELVDFDKYRVVKQEEKAIKLEKKEAVLEPLPIGNPNGKQPDAPEEETLDRIVAAFNAVFGGLEGFDSEVLTAQARAVGQALLEDGHLRDTILNNDEDVQAQVVHDKIKQEIGVITKKSNELQKLYAYNPDIQLQIDNALQALLQEKINPAYNEDELKAKIIAAMSEDFSKVAFTRQTTIEEIVDTMFEVLQVKTLPNLDGLSQLKKVLNLCYRSSGREEDLQEWLQTLVTKFEAFMKKVYYLRTGDEVAKQNGEKAQFLDAAKATWINHLHFDVEVELLKFKDYYEFLHTLRNSLSHEAPEMEAEAAMPDIHKTLAMYLYTTMINQKNMKSCGLQ